MHTLNHILDANLKTGNPDFYKALVPDFIYSNLKDGFGQRPYQQEAFGRFIFYWDQYRLPKGNNTHLLYHMATGSGKTIIMAGLIIYLYEKGYRNFLFFVNSTNIIEKTKDNFFNKASSKYLFANSISVNGKQVQIKESANFQSAGKDDINIVFSTIQGLHSRLNTPGENSLTYDDFEDAPIVLISDEAHHINATTKKNNKPDETFNEEMLSWENTVSRIFNTNNENILLEFTATADLSLPGIRKKYSDKLIFDYPLKQFRIDRYSKEVKVLQADLPPYERALQALLLSQYRQKIFEKYGIVVKPVILFKSKTIKESELFFEAFTEQLRRLRVSDLEKIKIGNKSRIRPKVDGGDTVPGIPPWLVSPPTGNDSKYILEEVFYFLEKEHITLENFVTELKSSFSEEKLLTVNSKDESEQKQLLVNSLEDETNPVRAIFAVDKLNEGWDVLNLFDIVRLYDSREAKAGSSSKTTMAEAQLIGRGARYYPFRIRNDQPLFERKFDDDPTHELRIGEELYYHSAYNPRYIQELNIALQQIGIKETKSERIPSEKIKGKKSGASQNTQQNSLTILSKLTGQIHNVNVRTGYSVSANIFDKTPVTTVVTKERIIYLSEMDKSVIRKAINKSEFYQFSNLKKIFSELDSVGEFITSKKYIANLRFLVTGLQSNIAKLSPDQQLEALIETLNNISVTLKSIKKF